MLKAVLYDLDGLMVDSEPLHGIASDRALNTYGRRFTDIPEDVRRSFYGKRVVDVAAGVVESLRLEVAPERLARERQEIFMELVEEGIEIMPGVESSLDFFADRGLGLAVVSSGDRSYVMRILEITGLAGRFDEVVTGDDVTVGKPDPQCYLMTAERLGVEPRDCLVLEDAHAGIRAALAAGMKVIGVENRFNDNFEGAHRVVPSLVEIDERMLEQLASGAGEEEA